MLNHYFNKLFSYIASKLLLKQINGIENIPKNRGYIVVANHISYVDIPAVYVVFLTKANTYIRFIAKKSLLKDAFFRTFTFLFENEQNRVIILDAKKPKKAFNDAMSALKKRSVVGIYPEGERSLNGKLQKGKTGAVRLALSAKVPIVPVGIRGTFELMSKGKSMPKIRKKVIISVGKPIYLDNYYNKKTTKKILRKLTDNLMKEIAKLIGQKYNY